MNHFYNRHLTSDTTTSNTTSDTTAVDLINTVTNALPSIPNAGPDVVLEVVVPEVKCRL